MSKKQKIVITCEHASNNIPKAYLELFKGHLPILKTHRAIDFGAPDIAALLGNELKIYVHYGKISRLIIDLNRSLTNRTLFSEYTNTLSPNRKLAIKEKYYFPYRNAVEEKIESEISKGHSVLHLSIHSFTPKLNNVKRNCSIGLLYDPSRVGEKKYCAELKKQILSLSSSIKVRFNYPYRGISDSFVKSLRETFKSNDYMGIEVEINQYEYFHNKNKWNDLKKIIVQTVLASGQ